MSSCTTRIATLFFLLSLMSPLSHGSINLPLDPEHNPYLIGKHTYHSKLACDGCPLAGTILDAQAATALIPRLESEKQFQDILTSEEREAVSIYLKTLFRLN